MMLGVFNLSALYTNYTDTGNHTYLFDSGTTTAIECGLFMCLKTFNSTIVNGTLLEDVFSVARIDTSMFIKSQTILKFQSPADLPNNATFLINQESLNIFGQSLTYLYSVSAVIGPGFEGNDLSQRYGIGYTSTILQSLFNNGSVDIAQAAEHVATTMTNVIRQQGNASYFLVGEAHTMEAFLVVRWSWIAYPFMLEALVLLFLIATIIKTSRSGVQAVWKASPIALLFHGLEDRGGALKNISQIKELSEINELSGKIRVELGSDGPGTTLIDAKWKKKENDKKKEAERKKKEKTKEME
jgi:hypothetical protein